MSGYSVSTCSKCSSVIFAASLFTRKVLSKLSFFSFSLRSSSALCANLLSLVVITLLNVNKYIICKGGYSYCLRTEKYRYDWPFGSMLILKRDVTSATLPFNKVFCRRFVLPFIHATNHTNYFGLKLSQIINKIMHLLKIDQFWAETCQFKKC